MALTSGTRIGSYEILSPLGVGGMGEVYRATDTRLNRTVAIKALHTLFANDPERVARFEREAQLLASINHPNIAAIYGIEDARRAPGAGQGGEKYLVLEFVDGRPLSDVLRDGALPIAEALALARQIAEALVAAHERGIIHRDLKPGNIMVTAEGVVKVLDFGLGKAVDSETASNSANSPTLTMAATQAGIILGTAGYMSPEQAKGRTADKRSDVWSFGCVLYEMLTGKRAFEGEDITETLAAIVRGEPDWTALPAGLAPSIRELVERCLIKNRAERLSDVSVVRFLLSERTSSSATAIVVDPASQTMSRSRRVLAPVFVPIWVCVGLLVGALATIALTRYWSAATPGAATGVTRLSIALAEGDQLASVNQAPVTVSPDGRSVVYAATHAGTAQLFLRSLSEVEPKALAGTEGAKSPFFSPDGRWIGFFAQGKLKKIAISGAAPQVVADAPDARGGAWGRDAIIYFAPINTSPIWRVPASGGTATQVTTLDRSKGEISHIWPHVTPDNTTLLFTARNGPGNDERRIVALPLSNGARRDLIQGGTTPRLVKTGHLVYGRLDGLFAVPWSSQRDIAGAVPVTLPEQPRSENEAGADYAVSDDGTLVYLAGGALRLRNRVVWANRSGTTEVLPLPEREYEAVAISPDGRQAVVQVLEGTVTLWMVDLERPTLTPFLVSGGSRQAPVWTADGKHVIYRFTHEGFRNLYWKSSDGAGAEERLTTKEGVVQTPMSVSTDGKWLLFAEGGAGTAPTVWVLPLDAAGERVPRLFLSAEESAGNGQFSPDGRWIAYTFTVSGRSEVYIRPFPGPGARKQISAMGADSPRWSRDGRALYFTASSNDKVFAVDVMPGPSFSTGVPRLLHEGRYKAAPNGNTAFDVSRDGRFLMVQPGSEQNALNRLDVVLNWFSELRSAK